jgi:hypothetical protein
MIRYDFDHHICTICKEAKRAHRVGQVPAGDSTDFWLTCTGCGDTDGPYAGPRTRDENDNRLEKL